VLVENVQFDCVSSDAVICLTAQVVANTQIYTLQHNVGTNNKTERNYNILNEF
jgi:hypothetical protein